jgi:PAS domain S-box-containing protein
MDDGQGNCLYVNERWMEMTGLTAAEAMGQGWYAAVRPEDRERVHKEWIGATDSSEAFSLHLQGGRGSSRGRYRALSHLPGDSSRGYIGVVQDVTEKYQAAERLREAKEAAEAASRTSYLQTLQNAVARNETSQVAGVSYTLKGMLSNLAVTKAAAAIARLEQLARAGEISSLRDALAAFEKEVQGLLPRWRVIWPRPANENIGRR